MRTFLIFLGLLLISIHSPAAIACSCAAPSGWLSETMESHDVFYGKAIESKWLNKEESLNRAGLGQLGRGWYNVITKFKIKDSLSPSLSPAIEVFHNNDEASCGMQFNIGQDQWVFISRDNNENYTTGLCHQHLDIIPLLLDYQATGQDIYIPHGDICHFILTSDDPSDVMAHHNLTHEGCALWSNESIKKRTKILQNYTQKHRAHKQD